VCLTFVFGALLEFALVNYASRSDMHRDNIKKQFPPSEMEHSSSIDPSSELLEPDGSANFAMVSIPRYDASLECSRLTRSLLPGVAVITMSTSLRLLCYLDWFCSLTPLHRKDASLLLLKKDLESLDARIGGLLAIRARFSFSSVSETFRGVIWMKRRSRAILPIGQRENGGREKQSRSN